MSEQTKCAGCGLPLVRESWTDEWAHKEGPLIMAYYPKHDIVPAIDGEA